MVLGWYIYDLKEVTPGRLQTCEAHLKTGSGNLNSTAINSTYYKLLHEIKPCFTTLDSKVQVMNLYLQKLKKI